MRGVGSQVTVLWVIGIIGLAAAEVQGLEIRVQGESGIELDVQEAGTVLHISGELRDDLGTGLPVENIELLVRNYREDLLSETLRGDYQGRFSRTVEFAPGVYEVEARYRGGSHVSPSVAQTTVTLEALPTELSITGPDWVLGSEPRGRLRMQATAGGRGLATFVTLSVNGEFVASVDLDVDGRSDFEIGPHLMIGENEVLAVVEGSDFREPQSSQFSIRRVESLNLRGEAEQVFRRLERGVEIEIFVGDQNGGIENAEVEMRLDRVGGAEEAEQDVLITSEHSDARGRAVGFFTFEQMGSAPWEASARVLPPEGEDILWQGSIIEVEDSVLGSIVRGLAMLAITGGALWLGRRGVLSLWAALAVVLRRTRKQKVERQKEEEIFAAVESVQLEAMTKPSESEERSKGAVTLQIWDEWRESPVEGAALTIQADGEEAKRAELISKGNGTIRLPRLDDGEFEFYVEAPGFVPTKTRIQMPSSRQYLRLTMTPVPLKIRRFYRWMLEKAGGRDHWGQLTPREIEEVLLQLESSESERELPRGHGQSWQKSLQDWESLADDERVELLLQLITSLVEETNFSGREYDHSLWDTSREAMKELAHRLQTIRESGRDV